MTNFEISAALDAALEHFAASRLAQTETLCRQVLAVAADNADALHLLGLVAYRAGRQNLAQGLVQRAISLKPHCEHYYNSLGSVYAAQGWLEAAAVEYRKAIQLKPEYAAASSNLGNVLRDLGRLAESIAAFQASLAADPQHVAAHNNLGIAYSLAGQRDKALDAYHTAITLDPASAQGHYNLANTLMELGDLAGAAQGYQHALSLAPDMVDAYLNFGALLLKQGKVSEAVYNYTQALNVNPRCADAWHNLGNIYRESGALAEAIEAYRRAIEGKPDFAFAINNLGSIYLTLCRYEEAEYLFRRAIAVKPEYVDAQYNLGNLYAAKGLQQEAIVQFEAALNLRPDFGDALNNLGSALIRQNRLDAAMRVFKRAITAEPGHAAAYSNLAHVLKDLGRHQESLEAYRKAILLKPEYALFFSNLIFLLQFMAEGGSEVLQAEQRRWHERHIVPLRAARLPHLNDRDASRRLKVGYVSSDFYGHAVGFFLLPLIEHHDRSQVEVYCYSSTQAEDAVTELFRRLSHVWCDVRLLNNEQLAARIREDKIDILVDLSLHAADNRLLVFARNPAPVQVSWLAYPGSSGLETIDYVLSDAHMEAGRPKPTNDFETPICLPDSWCCYEAVGNFPPVSAAPFVANGFVTFGSLNNFCKINDGVLECWAKVLNAAPRSQLLIVCPDGDLRDKLRGIFASQGVSPDRLELTDRVGWHEYLQVFARIDISLDTFPCSGMTTTCHCLYMGVPVVTLPGTTPVSRASLSLLATLGAGEWVADSVDDYVRIAAELARDAETLSSIRSKLRTRMQASPLMDAGRFARNLEATYRRMWTAWCAGTVLHE